MERVFNVTLQIKVLTDFEAERTKLDPAYWDWPNLIDEPSVIVLTSKDVTREVNG